MSSRPRVVTSVRLAYRAEPVPIVRTHLALCFVECNPSVQSSSLLEKIPGCQRRVSSSRTNNGIAAKVEIQGLFICHDVHVMMQKNVNISVDLPLILCLRLSPVIQARRGVEPFIVLLRTVLFLTSSSHSLSPAFSCYPGSPRCGAVHCPSTYCPVPHIVLSFFVSGFLLLSRLTAVWSRLLSFYVLSCSSHLPLILCLRLSPAIQPHRGVEPFIVLLRTVLFLTSSSHSLSPAFSCYPGSPRCGAVYCPSPYCSVPHIVLPPTPQLPCLSCVFPSRVRPASSSPFPCVSTPNTVLTTCSLSLLSVYIGK